MVQITKSHISLGQGHIVGKVSIDGGAVRGEGGPRRPQLVIPLTIALDNRPQESMIAVTSIKATLSTDPNATPNHALCEPTTESLVAGFPVRSFPESRPEHTVQLRFSLSTSDIEYLEALRQQSQSDVFTLYIGLETAIAGLKVHNETIPGVEPKQTPWDRNLGLFSEVLPFWQSQIETTVMNIESSTWIRSVLPGLGHDRRRLIEVGFPPPLPDHANAAVQFDKARRALDERRYGDCIQECRGLLNMWEKQFGATAKNHLAKVIGVERGWPIGDVRSNLLDKLWKEVGDVANAPHHPEGDVNAELFDSRDARFLLLLTAALSEYVRPR